MTLLSDGTILQDGLLLNKRKTKSFDLARIYFPVKAHVTKVYALDSSDNRDGETYVCDLQVPRFGMSLYKVPFLLDKADYDNYIHYGPLAATRHLDGTPFVDTYLDSQKHDGTVVLVQFVDGLVYQPVITKVFPHGMSGRKDFTKLSSIPFFSPDPRPATKDDGDNFKIRYNGTYFAIDKDGNVDIKQTGMSDDKGRSLKRPNHKKTINFELQDPIAGGLQKLSFKMDNTASGEISLEAVSLAGQSQKISLKPGIVALEVGTSKISIDAATDTIDLKNTAGDEIKISPAGGIKAKTVAGATMNLTPTGMVGLGKSGAELLDLFDKLLDKLNTLLTSMSTESHVGNLGYNVSPPINAADYLAAQTQIGLIKTTLATIKGGI